MTDREDLGRLVRDTWVKWAQEQPDPKPSWLTGWDELDDGQREVDMRIGEAVAAAERQRIRQLATSEAESMEASQAFDYLPIAAATLRDFADLLGGDA